MSKNSQIFIKIDGYKNILETVDSLKKQVEDAKSLLEQIEILRAQEEEELRVWQENIEHVEERLGFIDQTLFEPDA